MGKKRPSNYFFTLLLLFFASAKVNSQTNSIGFMNGSAITNVQSTMFLGETAFNYGYIGGIEISREFSNKIVVQTGIIYEHKGFKKFVSTTDVNGGLLLSDKKSSFNYNYFSVPLSVGYRYGGVFFGEFFVGVSFSGLFDSNRKLVLGSEVTKTNYTQNVHRFDVAPKIGLGQGYRFKKGVNLVFRAEFQHGLINIANVNYYPKSEVRLKGFYLGLSLQKKLVTLKKKMKTDENEI
jgi:hypothetical protein